MKHTIIALALCASASAAHAEFMDGNRLLADMNGTQMRQMSAVGYVMGASDALTTVTVCMPDGVTVGQAHDIVKRYLEDNPAIRHLSADSLVNRALSRVWPCQRSNQRGSGT